MGFSVGLKMGFYVGFYTGFFYSSSTNNKSSFFISPYSSSSSSSSQRNATMKLRIRSMATKQTTAITVPDASSLSTLKALIADSLAKASAANPNPNPVAPAPDSIHLSLNRTDELVAPHAADPLPSLGLTSGDLLFLSFSPFPKIPSAGSPPPQPAGNSGSSCSSNAPIGDNLSAGPSATEVDADSAAFKPADQTLGFLVRVITGTEDGVGGSILSRVLLLTHAALLDTGFALLQEPGSGLPQGWSSQASSLCLKYTVPEFLDQGTEINEKVAVIKFSVLGNLVTVYGYVGGAKPDIHRFCFDLAKVAPLFSSDLNSLSKLDKGELMGVFRRVKDMVSLPVMIDLCLTNGLPLPPCFMSLSADMKAKILDFLPGVDTAHAGSTCKELRNLSLDDNMWRQKMEREFGSSLNESSIKALGAGRWREKYKRAYTSKRSALRFNPRGRYQSSPATRPFGSGRHFFAGGYADTFPPFVGGGYAGTGTFPAFGRRVSPRCDFEGLYD